MKQVTITDSRGNGADFSQSCCKELTLCDSSFAYANFSKSQWENSAVSNCSFKESFWAEVRLKKLTLAASVFSGADFFKTPLKDLDFSDCKIDGITVSETFKELRGMQINLLQSADIARLLGIKIV
ncbi:MAG: pentapeptide repeat-containing protein [Phascolarctobacterium faecium]